MIRLRKKISITFMVIIASVLVGSILGFMATTMEELPDIKNLGGMLQPVLSSKVFDVRGEVIGSYHAEEQRTVIPLSMIPRSIQNAVLAIEDDRFYQHSGINLHGILRAILVNLYRRKFVQGASTITQQLARTLFLTQERTLKRKLKEMFLAFQIERHYRKEEILELYLNMVYFGNSAYGIETAARIYFGKHAGELNLSESATLAGVLRSPNAYNPYRSLEISTRRRNIVLDRMVELGLATALEAQEANATPLQLQRGESQNAPYFLEYVRQQLENKYGANAVYKGGLSITTTLDMRLQDIAQRVLEQGLDKAQNKSAHAGGYRLGKTGPLQGALLAIDPHKGYILAMVGGRNYKESQFNRAVQAKRQPGSVFKPFIYAAALDNGFTPSSIINDEPMVFKDANGKEWKPENFEGKFFGNTSLRDALTHSRNVVTVKLLTKIGLRTAIEHARHMGIQSPISPDYTLALGTSEVSLLELSTGYCTIANGGFHVEPIAILTVKDSNGNILEENHPQTKEGLNPATAYVLINILKDVIDRGTGSIIRRMGFDRPAAGKSGTTNNYNDTWFVGFTPHLLTGIWMGFDERQTLGKQMTGGMLVAPVWTDFMKIALEGRPVEDFPMPEEVVMVKIDAQSGLLATPQCRRVIEEAYTKGTEPTKSCNIHAKSSGLFSDMDYENLYPQSGTVPAGVSEAAKVAPRVKTPVAEQPPVDLGF